MNIKNLDRKNIKIKVDEKIFIKTLVLEDVEEQYVDWLNDYEIIKFTEQKDFKHTMDSTKDFVAKKYFSKNDLLFGIFVEGLHVGNIKLGPIKFEHMVAEISYFIGNKEFWGKGIASKCVKTIVQFAIVDLGLKKINAGYYENNIGSAKVFQKCGFVIEGIRHSDVSFENNRINLVLVGFAKK